MNKLKTLSTIAIISAVLQSAALAADWTSFRGGQTRTGATADKVSPPLSLRWKFKTGREIISSPSVTGGAVYVGSRDGKVYSVDADTGTKNWEFQTGDRVDSSPAVAGGAVYVGSRDGFLYALNAADGTLLWKHQTGGTDISSPLVASGTVFAGSGYPNTYIYALNASDGSLKWKLETGQMVYSSAAYLNGIIYIGSNDGKYYALDGETGQAVWAAPTNGGVYVSTPAVSGGNIIAAPGDFDHNVYAFNPADGSVAWKTELTFADGRAYVSSPAVSASIILVGMGYPAQRIAALDPADGHVLWTVSTGDSSPIGYSSSPAISGDYAYVGSAGGTILGLSLADGAVKWEFVTGGPVISSPAVSAGKLFAASGDGYLYAFW